MRSTEQYSLVHGEQSLQRTMRWLVWTFLFQKEQEGGKHHRIIWPGEWTSLAPKPNSYGYSFQQGLEQVQMAHAEEELVKQMRQEVLKPISTELAERSSVQYADTHGKPLARVQPEEPPLEVRASDASCVLDTSVSAYSHIAPPTNPLRRSHPVSARVEAARLRSVRALHRAFVRLVHPYIHRSKANAALEQWLHAMHAADVVPTGCVLPNTWKAEVPEASLRASLIAGGASSKEANAICREIGKLSVRLGTKVQNNNASIAGRTKPRVRLSEVHTGGLRSHRKKARLAIGHTAVELNKEHFAKLFVLLRRFRPDDSNQELKEYAFCVASRYACTCGGQLKAAATQAALQNDVYDCFNRWLGTSIELFASPLNCRWAPFCSAHPDVDAPFGSIGDAFRLDAQRLSKRCSFQANPPFVAATIDRAASLIEGLLTNAPHDACFSFAIILPEWRDNRGWRKLTKSQFLRRIVRLEPLQHGYVEGAQHTKRDIFRPSCHPTSVLVLQTEEGNKLWPPVDAFESELRNAFKPRHNQHSNREGSSPSNEGEDNDGGGGGLPHKGHELEAEDTSKSYGYDTSNGTPRKKKRKRSS